MRKQRGFTIVELLIVIVVIGILAAIVIVSYNGIQKKATTAALASDLANASAKLQLYQVDNSTYPNSISDCPDPSCRKYVFKSEREQHVHRFSSRQYC